MSVFSVEGKGVKFNTAAEIEPFLSGLTEDVTEIRLSGNTFGVEASKALAAALENKHKLEVRELNMRGQGIKSLIEIYRMLRWQTYSQAGCAKRYPLL